MANTVSFGYWVRRQRKALDLTQDSLARQVGCAVVTIRKIERDERRPSRQMAQRLADCLTIPPDERDAFIQCGLGEQPVDVLPLPHQPVKPAGSAFPPSLPLFLDMPTPESTSDAESRFVGRRAELDRLTSHLTAALAGDGHMVFVTGEAGRGKTALLAEFARVAQAAQPELIIAWGRCSAYAGSGDPYLPFRDIMEMIAGDVAGSLTAGIITREQARRLWNFAPVAVNTLLEISPALIDLLVSASLLRRQPRLASLMASFEKPPNSPERHQIFDQVTKMLQALARRQPLLLLLDDLQWADATSINLLFHLGRRLPGSRLLIVGTYRPSEIMVGLSALEPELQQPHLLEPIINEFRQQFGDIQLNLERFEPAAGRQLVDALLDREPNHLPESFRVALFWQTKGHPLFTIELIREMQARGDLIRGHSGQWVLKSETLDWTSLPVRVEAVIDQRLGRLDDTLRAILTVACVEGETFTAEVIAQVEPLEQRHLLRRLSQELEKRHRLVREVAAVEVNGRRLSRYQFTHLLFQQYLYQQLGHGERTLLHAQVAQALADLYQDQTAAIAVQLAHHYIEANDKDKAVNYLLPAGDRARALSAHAEAVEHYQRALAFLQEAGRHEQAARTLMKLGLTHHLAFNFTQAHQAYAGGFTLWRQARERPVDSIRHYAPAPHALRTNWHDPDTLDPTRPRTIWSVGLAHQLFSGLLTLSPELDVMPDVAHSWDVGDGGRTYVFHLRDDVFWSDGLPVTADDFVYAWQRALDPAGWASFAGALLGDIEQASAFRQGAIIDPHQVAVYAIDPLTLRVTLEGPTNYFPHLLTFPTTFPIPRHHVEKYGETWAAADQLVTNGPFRLKTWRRGDSLVLQRNPTYHNPWPGNVEQLELSLDADPTDLLRRYEVGDLDLLHLHLLPPIDMDRARQRHTTDYLSGPQLLTHYIWFIHLAQPPLNDERVRQALALALDQAELANVAMRGFVYPARGGFVPPEMPGYAPEVGRSYNPARSRQLLAEAGYPAGRGFPPLEALNRPDHEPLANYCQRAWREVLGIDVAWKTAPLSTLFERYEQSPPDLALGLWVADYPDPDCYLRVCVEIENPDWHHDLYRQLIATARRATDQAERLQLYTQAEAILAQAAPLIPLAYGRVHLLLKPWVKQYQLSTMKGQFWQDIIIDPH